MSSKKRIVLSESGAAPLITRRSAPIFLRIEENMRLRASIPILRSACERPVIAENRRFLPLFSIADSALSFILSRISGTPTNTVTL